MQKKQMKNVRIRSNWEEVWLWETVDLGFDEKKAILEENGFAKRSIESIGEDLYEEEEPVTETTTTATVQETTQNFGFVVS